MHLPSCHHHLPPYDPNACCCRHGDGCFGAALILSIFAGPFVLFIAWFLLALYLSWGT